MPDGFDLLVAPRAFRPRGPDANRELVARVREALEPGGTAVFVDVFRDGRGEAVALDAELLATTEAGRVYEPADAMEWLAAAGFAETREVSVPGTADGAVVGAASFK